MSAVAGECSCPQQPLRAALAAQPGVSAARAVQGLLPGGCLHRRGLVAVEEDCSGLLCLALCCMRGCGQQWCHLRLQVCMPMHGPVDAWIKLSIHGAAGGLGCRHCTERRSWWWRRRHRRPAAAAAPQAAAPQRCRWSQQPQSSWSVAGASGWGLRRGFKWNAAQQHAGDAPALPG